MPLSPTQAEEIASAVFEVRQKERKRLNTLRAYRRGDPELVWLPQGTPREMQVLAQTSRINLCQLVVRSSVQQLIVDGYKHTTEGAADEVWRIWQSNRWDRKQLGVNRAVGTYGVAYGLPQFPRTGDVPVMRAASPRQITATYDSDEDWPDYALEQRPGGEWWLYDNEHIYVLKRGERTRQANGRAITFAHVSDEPHGQDVTPVVRYLSDEDLDDPVGGDIEPMMGLQDMVNLTNFHLLVAQNYGAHGRQFLIGMMMDQVEKQLRSSAGATTTIRAKPEDFSVQEVSQTDLSGFIESREAGARFVAALSQTPTHELLGQLSNLSAAALVEARESEARKLDERTTVVGESHEQILGQAGVLAGVEFDPAARVRWKPTKNQRMFQMVDMLATIVDRFGVPPEAILSELPFSDATIEEWKEAMDQRRASGEDPPREQGGAPPNLAAL